MVICPIPEGLLNCVVLIENVETKRYLFSAGDKTTGEPGSEKGWKISSGFEAPKMVGADANYYNRAYFKIIPQGDKYKFQNEETNRLLFSDGDPIKGERGSEHGWSIESGFEAPCCVGTDANYYNRALWIAHKHENGWIFENEFTKRYVLSDGDPVKGENGDEGGWTKSPDIKGADANYYNRAFWNIQKAQGNLVEIQQPQEQTMPSNPYSPIHGESVQQQQQCFSPKTTLIAAVLVISSIVVVSHFAPPQSPMIRHSAQTGASPEIQAGLSFGQAPYYRGDRPLQVGKPGRLHTSHQDFPPAYGRHRNSRWPMDCPAKKNGCQEAMKGISTSEEKATHACYACNLCVDVCTRVRAEESARLCKSNLDIVELYVYCPH